MIVSENSPSSPKTPLLQGHPTTYLPPPPGSAEPPPYLHLTRTVRSDPPERMPKESAGMRFFKAFTVAVAVCMFSSFILSSVAMSILSHLKFGSPTYPNPSDGIVVTCVDDKWSAPSFMPPSTLQQPLGNEEDLSAEVEDLPFPPYSSAASFRLNVDAPLLFLLSRGSLSSGSVALVTDDTLSGHEAKVDIQVRYYSLEARDRAKVCLLRREAGAEGIGIYTPLVHWPERGDQLRFTITVRFPTAEHQSLVLKSFQTNLPLFRHDVATKGDVSFNVITLAGSNMPIVSEGLVAEYAGLTTSNSGISGSFNVSKTLALRTSNAAINTKILMLNEDDHHDTSLILKTSNSRIVSAVSLQSTTKKGGWYNVQATTSNGRLELAFPEAPPSSRLVLTGGTSNAPSYVSLHPNYEGAFSLTTSNAIPNIEESDAEDPTGERRPRRIEVHTVYRGKVEGYASWGEPKHGDEGGNVIIKTSNARNTLRI